MRHWTSGFYKPWSFFSLLLLLFKHILVYSLWLNYEYIECQYILCHIITVCTIFKFISYPFLNKYPDLLHVLWIQKSTWKAVHPLTLPVFKVSPQQSSPFSTFLLCHQYKPSCDVNKPWVTFQTPWELRLSRFVSLLILLESLLSLSTWSS